MYRLCLAWLVLITFVGCFETEDKNSAEKIVKEGEDGELRVDDPDLALVTYITQGLVSPKIDELASKSQALYDQINKACESESFVPLEDLRYSWWQAMKAYHYLEAFSFGPMDREKSTLLENIYSLPLMFSDQLIQGEIDSAEENKDQYIWSGADDESISGLDAMEYLLFAANTDLTLKAESGSCIFGKAVAANVVERVDNLSTAWQSELAYLESPEGQTQLQGYIKKMTDGLFVFDPWLKSRKLLAPLGQVKEKYDCAALDVCIQVYMEHPYALVAKESILRSLRGLDHAIYGETDKDYSFSKYIKQKQSVVGQKALEIRFAEVPIEQWQDLPSGEDYVETLKNYSPDEPASSSKLIVAIEAFRNFSRWLKADFIMGMDSQLPGSVQGDND